ncbi:MULTISPECIES: ATP-binding protein [unclassified Rhodococcus (in: high G+C Gram-positive bacteria)]|uniref:ATP-binding protein n=1 Tax=unclassified Rhodococcus (in: high G+C Gram-positive bacteria) TaxID=192944 RepID=UPI0020CBF17A|nr:MULTISPECIES: ATP-binding protein [unclassified Rhodococcus (in: high G+C Gram-positive bacteria)]
MTSITAAGFRGIGPKAALQLHPAPGITIVSGRNGSGKSSFAEALESAATGASYRLKNRALLWAGSCAICFKRIRARCVAVRCSGSPRYSTQKPLPAY